MMRKILLPAIAVMFIVFLGVQGMFGTILAGDIYDVGEQVQKTLDTDVSQISSGQAYQWRWTVENEKGELIDKSNWKSIDDQENTLTDEGYQNGFVGSKSEFLNVLNVKGEEDTYIYGEKKVENIFLEYGGGNLNNATVDRLFKETGSQAKVSINLSNSESRKVIFVESGKLKTYTPENDRTEVLYDKTTVDAIGSSNKNLDTDNLYEVPFITNGKLKIVDSEGEIQILSENARSSKTRLSINTTSQEVNEVLYAGNSNNGYDIYSASVNSNPELVKKPSDGTQAVVGKVDYDGDSKDEIVFVGGSQTLQYVDDDGTVISTGVGVGSNNGIGVGDIEDFNKNGVPRALVVDGSNNIALVKYDGTKTLVTSNGPSRKSPIGSVDINSDSGQEIVFLNPSTNEISYVEGYNDPTIKDLSSNSIPDKMAGVVGGQGKVFTGQEFKKFAVDMPEDTVEWDQFKLVGLKIGSKEIDLDKDVQDTSIDKKNKELTVSLDTPVGITSDQLIAEFKGVSPKTGYKSTVTVNDHVKIESTNKISRTTIDRRSCISNVDQLSKSESLINLEKNCLTIVEGSKIGLELSDVSNPTETGPYKIKAELNGNGNAIYSQSLPVAVKSIDKQKTFYRHFDNAGTYSYNLQIANQNQTVLEETTYDFKVVEAGARPDALSELRSMFSSFMSVFSIFS